MAGDRRLEEQLRELLPQVLGAVIRRFRDFAASEDAVQQALMAAAQRWPGDGVPEDPRAWLIRVAARRMIDHVRAEAARRRREELVVSLVPAEDQLVLPEDGGERDDTLTLLFMCCHPALSPSSAIALTLRAVGGLTTAEIARAFLVPEATMAQRISRAKQSIKASGAPFELPTAEHAAERRSASRSATTRSFPLRFPSRFPSERRPNHARGLSASISSTALVIFVETAKEP